ncbi:MAG TPA: beta-ketoacyl synthase N-terminal-like domain-containing protein, partial [Niastella sp.]
EGACRISTIKPLAGHMHATSALGALLKIIRSFQTNTIQGIKGLQEINPDLDTVNQPCRLLTAPETWLPGNEPRLAGLHSYGAGGNNVHLLIEEYKAPEKAADAYNALSSSKFIIPVSAETEAQCKQMVQNLLNVLVQHPEYVLADLSYTLQCGRDSMKYRVAFAVNSYQELMDQATAFLQGDTISPVINDPASAKKLNAWLKGESVVWNSGRVENVQRLHLPGYPFNCQPYWFSEPEQITATVAADKKETALGAEYIVRQVLSDFLLKPAAEIALNKQFSELGFDSMLVTKIAFALNRRYGLEVEPAVFFEHTTPAQLIAFISQEFAHQFDKADAVPASGNKNSKKAGQRDAGNVPIAIVGVAGNFPKASGIDALWQNLVAGKHCIEEVPADRWPVNEYYEQDAAAANRAGKSYGKWGGFLDNFYYFDPLFFNISPLETEIISPKERIFLQCAWHAMEDAGYTPASLSAEQVGVFAGVTRAGVDPYKISPSTVSNRVSYVLNLNGPSLTIDTACSSSLVAIHEACRHIQSGECTMALAGGVHVFLDPSHFSVLSSMYMLSPDGVSRSFGDNANGMVPGEGGGVLLLKSLDRAMADGDLIYGVIKGSAINHGGKANGFTVPNPKAHQRLIQTALKRAGVNARDVSYVEAHGTGTSLGDPVEVRGLTEAFKADTADTQYCRLGSLKSNIGHLEAAAGVAGLIKILLQMKHKKLVPSLHAKTPNPQINFAKTPFVVQQQLEAWEPVNTKGNAIPRIACVSSFGAGGANAHVILEEYDQERHRHTRSSVPANGYGIVLSARDQEQLQEQVKQLLAFLQTTRAIHIADLAFTLQTGRMAFEKRLALEVTTLQELEIKLNDYLNGHAVIDKLYVDPVTATPVAIDEGVVEKWLSEHDYSALLHAWVKGGDIDWRKLYGSATNGYTFPHRIALPGYPFLKEYYGLPKIFSGQQVAAVTGNEVSHPLVHTNHSTFFETRLGARFTGEEFFLKDHVVKGDKVLPGVAYLEMARAAIQQAAQYTDATTVRLKHVAWIQPVIVHTQPVNIDINLSLAEDGAVNFEIVSQAPGASDEHRVHNQGMALLLDRVEAPVRDVNAIRQSAEFVVYPKQACYHIFEKIGIAYGTAHKAIEQIAVSDSQILAELSLPDVVAGTLTQFQLHPSLLDGALQSIIGFRMRNAYAAIDIPLAIPFAIDELTVFAPCEEKMWAHIRTDKQNGLTGNDPDFDNLSFD